MNDKKNIDRLFQEKFKDFDVAPTEIVWEKIKARQNKDKKKTILIPLWYKVAGIAAIIALIFGIGYLPFNTVSQKDNTLTNSDVDIRKEKTSNDFFEPTHNKKDKQQIVSTELKKEQDSQTKEKTTKNTIIKDSYTDNSPNITKEKVTNASNQETLSSNKNGKSTFSQAKTKENNLTSFGSNAIAINDTSQQLSKKTNNAVKEQNIGQYQNENTSGIKNQLNPPLGIDKKNNLTSHEVTENQNHSNLKLDHEKENDLAKNNNNVEKRSIFDAIAQKEEQSIDAVTKESTSSKKWNVAPIIAPVYYNSIGDGSPIDDQFSDNNKNGEINMSYGIQVAYNINKKISVRSGVNKVDLSYTTADIGFSPSAVGQNLEGVSYNENAGAILISDIGNVRNDVELASDFTRNSIDRTQNPGLLNQSIGYIEVPVEMEYAILDKKFGIQMIGGISTLFLQNNEVTIEAGDLINPIGESNNLNPVSFSGNIGVGMGYNITKQFEITLEPIFKYQLNAFSNNANNFRPYYFGVYSGVSIKF
ncbi:hypothetical protein [Aquimarina pacifica]|uniref:hypothetical protein n=1 Tax=Aquimarina pacifica TaxID=1296415 RepID=UPI00046F4ED9|nr:hypothetical protein [Aquimarina pacifica]